MPSRAQVGERIQDLTERAAARGAGHLLLISTFNGFTLDETGVGERDAGDGGVSLPAATPGDPAGVQEMADMARDYIASLPVTLFPSMVALADEFAFADPDERFELLLDIFIDGLARRASAG